MRHFAKLGPLLALWLLCVAAVAGVTARGQHDERDRLFERFASRADTGASFVGAYVDDIFNKEQRLADRVSATASSPADLSPADFSSDAKLLGFPAAVLLDQRGRVVELAPAAPAMVGTEIASRYPHLAAAMAGRRTVSGVVPSAAKGTPIVAFALPLSQGPYRVLSLGFSLADGPLQTFLERQPILGAGGYIIDGSGKIIASAVRGRSKAVPADDVARALRRPTLVDERLLAAASIPGTSWNYVLDAPVDGVLAPVAGNGRHQWILLATLATLGLVGLLFAQRAMGARARARREQQESDDRLRSTVQNAPIGMTMVALDGGFVEPNARLCSMLGRTAEELTKMTFQEVTHPDDLASDLEFTAQLTSGRSDSYEMEKRYLRSDDSLLWGRLAVSVVRDDQGAPLYFVNQIQDVTAFRQARAELEHRAHYDSLTDLGNRSLLMDRLNRALSESRGLADVGVGFCDIDHFKQINDTHGHHAGDEVLREVARRLRAAVRVEDTVARMGGDEFILLLTDLGSLAEAEQVLERANQAVAQPIEVDGETLLVGLSRGLALGGRGDQADTLLRDADAALYAAKKAGRGGCVVYHPHLRDTSLCKSEKTEPSLTVNSPRIASENQDPVMRALLAALADDAIGIAYQPIFDLSENRIVGAEALLRLSDQAGTDFPAEQVVSAAEESGLIIDLGLRVIKQAALQSASWRAEHGLLLPVTVNVSAAQLELPGFSDDVLRAVAAAGLPAEALVIELTESVLLRKGSGGMEQLNDLRDLGIELAIDDFGTGYASLALLHHLPATTLKIDRSFVAGIPDDPRALAIVEGVIKLARNLRMTCIAEGIETENQRAYLAERGVLGQGFLLGRPGDRCAIDRLLSENRNGSGNQSENGSRAGLLRVMAESFPRRHHS